MRAKNLGLKLKNIISFDEVEEKIKAEWDTHGVQVFTLAEVIEKGRLSGHTQCPQDWEDCPLFSYTSGTTGDSKGVKLTHKNLMMTMQSMISIFDLSYEDSIISYLPYPHSFEQVCLYFAMWLGLKIGYYQGNPLKLVDDCQQLRPAVFPSVPRLYNRIYAKIKGGLEAQTGVKGFIAK
jgi:long-chain acyl-CoA synthetase